MIIKVSLSLFLFLSACYSLTPINDSINQDLNHKYLTHHQEKLKISEVQDFVQITGAKDYRSNHGSYLASTKNKSGENKFTINTLFSFSEPCNIQNASEKKLGLLKGSNQKSYTELSGYGRYLKKDYKELFVISVDQSTLQAAKTSGFDLKFTGNKCNATERIYPEQIQALLSRIS